VIKAEDVFEYLLILPATPFVLLVEKAGVEVVVDGGPVEPYFYFCALTSVITWVAAASLGYFFSWGILLLWALAVYLCGQRVSLIPD